ncbi:thermoresistant glucokinase family carbohydrate kinase [Calycina marina]|uniref:Gluconokinase n=1 Tax=Calycina marina TaxID=1763456 RepID=A0A9P7Z716_9HELO|nr:thermoresistant glucokinase family carbohydrate kinase [Calycina marina]
MLSYDRPTHIPTDTTKTKVKMGQVNQTQSTVDHLPINTSPSKTMANGVAQTGNAQPAAPSRHIWLVTGPAGCGKSTIAKFLSESLKLPFLEGDEFHPKANVEKMAAGKPLNDADRWDWLGILREAGVRELERDSQGVVITCSALKRKYRDVIRVAQVYHPDVKLHFIYLHAPEEVLVKRVAARENHYMGASMVHSQFEDLEEPVPEEKDVIKVDVSGSLAEIEKEALAKAEGAVRQGLVSDASS